MNGPEYCAGLCGCMEFCEGAPYQGVRSTEQNIHKAAKDKQGREHVHKISGLTGGLRENGEKRYDWIKALWSVGSDRRGSEGIGQAFAHQLASEGVNLVLLARRKEPLAECAAGIEKQFPSVQVKTIAVDLCSDRVLETIRPVCDDLEVGMLIYNAGATHGHARFLDNDLDQALSLVKLNCDAPLMMAHYFGRKMRERQRGAMMFLTSMVGLAGSAHVVSYSATKAFDHVFAEALWHDLAPDNIDVLSLVVGATDTPAASRSSLDFSGNSQVMTAEEVAREGLENLGNGPLWIAGEQNRAIAGLLFHPDRRRAVETLSCGAAAVYGLEYQPVKQSVKQPVKEGE